jgi:hypothetical protein
MNGLWFTCRRDEEGVEPVTEIIKKNGKWYATIAGVEYRLIRIFECANCGAKVEAGSDEFLNAWRKLTVLNEPKDADHLYYCANCD